MSYIDNELSQLSKNLTKSLDSQILDINTFLEKATTQYLSQRKEIETMKEKMNKIALNMDAKITLDIGGTLFSTTLETLTSEKDTFFTAMFSEQFNTKPDKNGHYFIDRTPLMFHYILNYLRNPSIPLNFKNIEKENLMEEFEDEIEFYHIQSLMKIKGDIIDQIRLRLGVLHISQNIEKTELQKGVNTYTKRVGNPEWRGIMLKTCKKWRITLLADTVIMIGVADSSVTFNPEITSYNKNGWYVYGQNGGLFSQVGIRDLHWGCVPFNHRGDVIDCVFQDGNFGITINGKDYGFAYIGLSDSLCPAIELYYNDASISIQKLE
jgi:hypothetical protein